MVDATRFSGPVKAGPRLRSGLRQHEAYQAKLLFEAGESAETIAARFKIMLSTAETFCRMWTEAAEKSGVVATTAPVPEEFLQDSAEVTETEPSPAQPPIARKAPKSKSRSRSKGR